MRTVAWLAFLLAGTFLVYVLAGYPLLLGVLARFYPKPVRRRCEPRNVTILLPVHNGEKWIRQKLDSILALNYPRSLVQVLILSDGSTDETEKIACQYSGHGVKVIRMAKSGKAVAINNGVPLADGEILFFTDVRQRLHPDCLASLIANFADPEVGAVCGELIILDGETQEEKSVGLYWKLEKWIRRQLSSMGTLLVLTGCVYAIRRELVEPLPADALGDDIFMPQAVLRKGYRVIFEEDAKAYDYPTTLDIEFSRKVRTLAGLFQFVRQRGLGSYPFQFFSYKVSRLLLPYALITIAVATSFLPFPFAAIGGAPQIVLYSLAALDPWIGDTAVLKRISSPARMFCMLMVAALWSVSVLFIPATSLWKVTEVRAPKVQGDA